MTLAEYVNAGLPACDRRWNGADLARAAAVLKRMVEDDAGQLPRYQGERSGAAFARLTADENLIVFRNRSLPIEQRLPDALIYAQANGELLMVYLAAFNQHAAGDSELVELMGGNLRMTVVMIQLVEELLPTLDKNDPTYPVRLEGLRQMKSGMASIVSGNLQTLTESKHYRTSELKRLIGYLQDTLPEILPQLPEHSRAEALVRLRSFIDDPNMQHLRPELDELVSVAEKASPGIDP